MIAVGVSEASSIRWFRFSPNSGGLHVVRIASKRCIAPASIHRILAGMPEASQAREMTVLDARGLEAARQAFPI